MIPTRFSKFRLRPTPIKVFWCLFLVIAICIEPGVRFSTAISLPPWATYGHDPQHTSRSPYQGPRTPAVQWTFPIERGRAINMAASIDADGTVYIGTWGDRRDGYFPGKLYAINADGTPKWQYDPPEPEQDSTGRCCIWGTIEGSVTIGTDGTLYFGRGDNKLYALDRTTGTLKWQFRTFPDGFPEQGGQVISSPVIGTDGTIYFGTVPQFSEGIPTFFAVNPDGSEKWHYRVDGEIFGAPALGHDGTIYFGDRNRTFHALADGVTTYVVKWTYQSPQADWYGAPTVASDGTIYLPAADVTGFCRAKAKLIALTDQDDHAMEKWVFTAPLDDSAGAAEVHAALGPTAEVYFSVASINNSQIIPCGGLVDQGALYALTDAGSEPTLSWTYTATYTPTETYTNTVSGISGSAIDRYGIIYVAVRGESRVQRPGYIDALDPVTGQSIWPKPVSVAGELWWSPPALGANGGLYVGDATCTDTPNLFPCELVPALYAIRDHYLYLPYVSGGE